MQDPLKRLIASRRADAQAIETEIIIACERAACRSRRERNRPSDWNAAAWRRYVREAFKAPHRFAAVVLPKIYQDIYQLEQLAAQRCPGADSQHAKA